MRLGLLADVHSNLSALECVLPAIDSEGVDERVCLGDVVGYHASPSESIALVASSCERVVQGNHDREVAGSEPTVGTSRVARIAQQWTRERLAAQEIAWLDVLPGIEIVEDRFMAVHGCYLNSSHVNGYVTRTMLEANLRAIADNEAWPPIAFCGHTHIPMVAWLKRGEVHYRDLSTPVEWPEACDAVLINPGSVGQPRDGDHRASFATVDLEARVVKPFRRDYDIDVEVQRLHTAGLPDVLGDRLRNGR